MNKLNKIIIPVPLTVNTNSVYCGPFPEEHHMLFACGWRAQNARALKIRHVPNVQKEKSARCSEAVYTFQTLTITLWLLLVVLGRAHLRIVTSGVAQINSCSLKVLWVITLHSALHKWTCSIGPQPASVYSRPCGQQEVCFVSWCRGGWAFSSRAHATRINSPAEFVCMHVYWLWWNLY